jgi:hypothetical protein
MSCCIYDPVPNVRQFGIHHPPGKTALAIIERMDFRDEEGIEHGARKSFRYRQRYARSLFITISHASSMANFVPST